MTWHLECPLASGSGAARGNPPGILGYWTYIGRPAPPSFSVVMNANGRGFTGHAGAHSPRLHQQVYNAAHHAAPGRNIQYTSVTTQNEGNLGEWAPVWPGNELPPLQTLLDDEHVASTTELNDLLGAVAADRAFTAAVAYAYATTGGSTPRSSHSHACTRHAPRRPMRLVCAQLVFRRLGRREVVGGFRERCRERGRVRGFSIVAFYWFGGRWGLFRLRVRGRTCESRTDYRV